MKLYTDLHLHSHYSRATSPKMNVLDLSKYAKYKGLNLLGTGDFQHPEYLKELKSKLKRTGKGLYEHDGIYYVLQTEIANIYTHNGRGRKVHHVILAPDFDAADELQAEFRKWGRIDYDGRPIFGKSSRELVKTVMGVSSKCEVIPAHIWTPWFSLFGSKSGYDSIKECYEEELKHIHALETGLSSDPLMNWRWSALDNYTLISNSDSHSPWPWRMGRECNVFDIKPSYDDLIRAIRTRRGLLMTIEVDPAYGKYHWDGHRKCSFSCNPREAVELNNICPVCRQPLTIGVEHRVEELADREPGYKPRKKIPFKSLIPLAEIIAKFLDMGVNTKTVWKKYQSWIDHFNTEFNIMLEAPEEEIRSFDKKIGEAIIKVRNQEVEIKPGYDGEYGAPVFSDEDYVEEEPKKSQPDLKSFF
ncbi:DNA helicase UvrD [archaeon]|nr:DNA helicase UvrD [archaeon]